jgi:hypothetical protein
MEQTHLTIKEQVGHFNLDIIEELDDRIVKLKPNIWIPIDKRDYETKLAVIKDWIDLDILLPYELVLSEDYKSFKKRLKFELEPKLKPYKRKL